MPTNPIFKKLQLKPDTTLCVLGAPASYKPVLRSAPTLKAAVKEGGMVWISYPKGKTLETDLNRDILREELAALGLEAVRQIAIDDTWSALRFKVTN